MVSNVMPAVLQIAQSMLRKICVLTRFAIDSYPSLSKSAFSVCAVERRPNCPQGPFRIANNVPRSWSTLHKSFCSYSLKVKGRGHQWEALNGEKSGSNGKIAAWRVKWPAHWKGYS